MNELKVSYAQTVYGKKEIDAVVKCLKESTQMGNYSSKFEKKISSLFDKKYGLYVNSGSSALYIGMEASNFPEGGEVITPALTFSTTIGCIVKSKLIPVFTDVGFNDYCIDVSAIEKNITSKTVAIVAPNLMGNICNWEKISEIAKKYNLKVIEDAAQSFGAKFNNKICGSHKNITCFSAHPLKNLNAIGDAGFMTLNNLNLAGRISKLKNHGLKTRDHLEEFGYNSRLDNVQAAILNFRLNKYKKYINLRRKNAKIYNSLIDKSFVILPEEKKEEFNTFHTYIIQTPNRSKLINYLKSNNIDTYIHYPVPAHMQQYYKKNFRNFTLLPNTVKQSKTILSLPINHSLKKNKIEYVAKKINYFYKYLS